MNNALNTITERHALRYYEVFEGVDPTDPEAVIERAQDSIRGFDSLADHELCAMDMNQLEANLATRALLEVLEQLNILATAK